MAIEPARLELLSALARKVLWLSSWTIHHANYVRPNKDGLKVGGHQASSASLVTIMSALYFSVLRPEDRVAVKPHASPLFHAIQYLFGRQTRDKLENFRGFKGAQSYPSRTKDIDDVDFSTGSVGLGVAQTLFASLVQDYVKAHGWMKDRPEGRMIALVGDAELDEGNIFEALLEGWKQGLRNTWWIIDYNRQSLDAVIREGLWEKLETMFRNFGWDVVIVKYGKLMQAAFAEPGGEALRKWIDSCFRSYARRHQRRQSFQRLDHPLLHPRALARPVERQAPCSGRVRAVRSAPEPIRQRTRRQNTRKGSAWSEAADQLRTPRSPLPIVPLAISSMASRLFLAATRRPSSISIRGCRSRSAR